MQNFGPIHIEKNIEHAAYVDASTNVTIAPSQTIVEAPAQTVDGPETEETSPIGVSTSIDKADFVRIVNALAEYGVFVKRGTKIKAKKNQVIKAFAQMIGDDDFEKSFYNDLKSASAASLETNTKIFDALSEAVENYINK